MKIEAPYHEGERAVQDRAGERDVADRNGRMIADTILSGALPFIERQSLLVLGSRDQEGRPWASLLGGPAGFMRAVTDRRIDVDLRRTTVDDALLDRIERHPRIGSLIIDLATRRRLRVNGEASRVDGDSLCIHVLESYPNCTKYIQGRQLVLDDRVSDADVVASGRDLGDRQLGLISSADTLFVASAHETRGTDVSHRGGPRGFVEVVDARTIRIPDYAGNGMFNTLGNFVACPEAGVAIPDFTAGRVLQLMGRTEILWDVEESDIETGGTRRWWRLHVHRWDERPLVLRDDA